MHNSRRKSCPTKTTVEGGGVFDASRSVIIACYCSINMRDCYVFLASATALMEARDKLIIHLYANRSRSRVMTLKDRLSNFSQGTRSISEDVPFN